jgi:tetratricopeptide (TPR) repeat protein
VERRAATGRLLNFYLDTVGSAATTLYPQDHTRRLAPRRSTQLARAAPIGDAQEAYAWLERELGNVVALTTLADQWPDEAVRLSVLIGHHLDQAGHLPEADTIHTTAATAACRLGDDAAEAAVLADLGRVYARQGLMNQLEPVFSRAADLARAAGDHLTEARALTNLATARWQQLRPQEMLEAAVAGLEVALRYNLELAATTARANLGLYLFRLGRMHEAHEQLDAALEVWDRTGHPFGAETLSTLVDIHCRYGRLDEAMDVAQRGLRLIGPSRNATFGPAVLSDVGYVHLCQGNLDAALANLTRACDGFSTFRERRARTLSRVGEVRRRMGDLAAAADLHEEALRMYRSVGNQQTQPEVMSRLALVWLDQGRVDQALDGYAEAHALSAAGGLVFDRYDASIGLARAHEARHEFEAAQACWREALSAIEELDLPGADEIRRMLDQDPVSA